MNEEPEMERDVEQFVGEAGGANVPILECDLKPEPPENHAELPQLQWANVREQIGFLSREVFVAKQSFKRETCQLRAANEHVARNQVELSAALQNLTDCVWTRVEAEASERTLSCEQFDRRCSELRASQLAEGEQLRRALEAEVAERLASDEAAAKRLKEATQQFEALLVSSCTSLQAKVEALLVDARPAGVASSGPRSVGRPCDAPPEDVAASATAGTGDACSGGTTVSRGGACDSACSSGGSGVAEKGEAAVPSTFGTCFEAALGDVMQCLETEVQTRQRLSDDFERLREEFAEDRRLREASEEQNEVARLHTHRCLQAEILGVWPKIQDEACRLEREVRSGLNSLEVRLQEVVCKVPDVIRKANSNALDSLAVAFREDLYHLEERVAANSLHAIDSRLQDLDASLRHDVWRGVLRSEEDGCLIATIKDFASSIHEQVCQQGASMNSRFDQFGIRMNEVIEMVHEEVRRQDRLDSKLTDVSDAFREKLRQQEETTLRMSIDAMDHRFDEVANTLREELRRHEPALETHITELTRALQEERFQISEAMQAEASKRSAADEDLKDLVEGRVMAEVAVRGAEISELKASVAAWSQTEKELRHAMYIHTHDLTVDRKRVAAALAAAVTVPAPAGPEASLGGGGDGNLTTLAANSLPSATSQKSANSSSHVARTPSQPAIQQASAQQQPRVVVAWPQLSGAVGPPKAAMAAPPPLSTPRHASGYVAQSRVCSPGRGCEALGGQWATPRLASASPLRRDAALKR
mmetsp:Transcript_786/g.1731  ORF Transcript_786/g.1731 Transcript_786/m.1731 type:complete len:760 (+) Transcript_786:74-2353(+)